MSGPDAQPPGAPEETAPRPAARLGAPRRLAGWCRREPLPAGALLILAGALGWLGFTLGQAREAQVQALSRERHARAVAEAAREAEDRASGEAERATSAERHAREETEHARRAEAEARQQAERAHEAESALQSALGEARRLSYEALLASAAAHHAAGDAVSASVQLNAAPEGWRDWEWAHLAWQQDRAELAVVLPALPVTLQVAQQHVLVATDDGGVHVLAGDGRPALRLVVQADASGQPVPLAVLPLAALPGARVAVGAGTGRVEVYGLPSGTSLAHWDDHEGAVLDLAAAPDGVRLASAGADGRVLVRDVQSGAIVGRLTPAGRPRRVMLDKLGERVLIVEDVLGLWDVASGQRRDVLHEDGAAVSAALFLPDGQHVLVAAGAELSRWNVRDGDRLARVELGRTTLAALALSVDGTRLTTARSDGALGLRDATTLRPLAALPGHLEALRDVARLTDGRFASIAADKTLRVWRAQTSLAPAVDTGLGHVVGLSVSGDGARLLLRGADGALQVRDAATGGAIASVPGPFEGAVFAPDGSVLVLGRDQRPSSLDPSTLEPLGTDDGVAVASGNWEGALLALSAGAVEFLAARSGHERLAVAGTDDAGCWVALMDPDAAAAPVMLDVGPHPVTALALGEDVLVATADGAVAGHCGAAEGVAPAVQIVSAGGTVVWRRSDGRVETAPSGADGGTPIALATGATALALAADGQRLFTGDVDGRVQVHATDGRPLLTLRGHGAPVTALAITAAGGLFSIDAAGTLRLWSLDAASAAAFGR